MCPGSCSPQGALKVLFLFLLADEESRAQTERLAHSCETAELESEPRLSHCHPCLASLCGTRLPLPRKLVPDGTLNSLASKTNRKPVAFCYNLVMLSSLPHPELVENGPGACVTQGLECHPLVFDKCPPTEWTHLDQRDTLRWVVFRQLSVCPGDGEEGKSSGQNWDLSCQDESPWQQT